MWCVKHNSTVCNLTSPCYFDFSEVEDGDVKRDQLNKWIKDNNVGGHHFIPKIQYLTRFLFASLCYHWDYLSENLHPKSRLLSLSLISQCPEDLRSLSVVKYPWNKTKDTPTISGIPPHVIMLSDLKRFENKIDGMGDDLMK